MLGVVIALALGSTFAIARRARNEVSAVSFASEASAFDDATRGGFDGLDDKLVFFDDEDGSIGPTLIRGAPLSPQTQPDSQQADVEAVETMAGDPAILL